jgi:hypothetical protein
VAVARSDERRGSVRTCLLDLALVPGFLFGLTNLLEAAPAHTALWIEVCGRLVGLLLIAAASYAAYQLARNRAVAFAFSVYGFVMVGLLIVATVLVANGGAG